MGNWNYLTILITSIILLMSGCFEMENKENNYNSNIKNYLEIKIQINTTTIERWNLIIPIPVVSTENGYYDNENDPIELISELNVISGDCDFEIVYYNYSYYALHISSEKNVILFCNKSSDTDEPIGDNSFSRFGSNAIFLNTSKNNSISLNYCIIFDYPGHEKGIYKLINLIIVPGWQEVEFDKEIIITD